MYIINHGHLNDKTVLEDYYYVLYLHITATIFRYISSKTQLRRKNLKIYYLEKALYIRIMFPVITYNLLYNDTISYIDTV